MFHFALLFVPVAEYKVGLIPRQKIAWKKAPSLDDKSGH
jgi:hypothetical protein